MRLIDAIGWLHSQFRIYLLQLNSFHQQTEDIQFLINEFSQTNPEWNELASPNSIQLTKFDCIHQHNQTLVSFIPINYINRIVKPLLTIFF